MPAPRRTATTFTAALLALPLVVGCDIGALEDAASASPSASTPAAGGASAELVLPDAVAKLATGEESREGYDRDKFKHWVDEDGDGCDARDEVLLEEATTAPEQGPECELTGGEWTSYYDGETVTDASDLDIDHMVPLAEAWDSGASDWTDERREAYANDLDAPASLVAVTAGSNRSKSDQDPAEWMPPAEDVHCTYSAEWVATKLRWELTVDTTEQDTLEDLAADCADTPVEYEPAS